MTPEQDFDTLAATFAGDLDVSLPADGQGFGSGTFRHRGKIFAMLRRGHLVVKLPSTRVDSLVASGDGARFDRNQGRPMREWLVLDPDSALDWAAIAREALTFVSSNAVR